MKRLGIDINEVLRFMSAKFYECYMKEFGFDGIPENPYVFDFFSAYKWSGTTESIKYLKEIEDMVDDINPIYYQPDQFGNAPADYLLFNKKEKIKLSPKEVFNRFLYQDYILEIFAGSSLMYKGFDLQFKNFYLHFKDKFEIVIISKENFFSIPLTLSFLALLRSNVSKYVFTETYEDAWNNCDILITANPELLTNIPEGKLVIKILKPFNAKIKADLEAIYITDFSPLKEGEEDENIIANNKYNEFIEYTK